MVIKEMDSRGWRFFLLVLIGAVTTSCNQKKMTDLEDAIQIPADLTVEKLMENTEEYQLLGRRGKIVFPDRTAEVEYVDEHTMHWKITDKNNAVLQGTERISYVQISEHQFFVNWIENSGFTVSQVIDTKTGEVRAFRSFNDAKSHSGGRSSTFVKGIFEFGQ